MSSRVVGAGGLWRSNWGRDTRLVQGIRTRRLFFAPFSLLAKKEKTTASPVSSCWWTGPSCGCDSDPPQSPPLPAGTNVPAEDINVTSLILNAAPVLITLLSLYSARPTVGM